MPGETRSSKIEQYQDIHCIVFLSCIQPIIWEIQFRVAPWCFCQHAQSKFCAMSLYIPGCILLINIYDTTFFIFFFINKNNDVVKDKNILKTARLLLLPRAPSSRREPELTTTVTLYNCTLILYPN